MLVLVLPINLLWKVKISLRQKLTLGALLSLTVFTVAVAIARIILVLDVIAELDVTWLNTLSVVEQDVGTSSLVSFPRPLLPHEIPIPSIYCLRPDTIRCPALFGGLPYFSLSPRFLLPTLSSLPLSLPFTLICSYSTLPTPYSSYTLSRPPSPLNSCGSLTSYRQQPS